VIAAEAVAGAPVRLTRPDGELWDARGVIEHPEGRGALVRWNPPAQPDETWVPDISWLVLDEDGQTEPAGEYTIAPGEDTPCAGCGYFLAAGSPAWPDENGRPLCVTCVEADGAA
jgi:hypothetical protein